VVRCVVAETRACYHIDCAVYSASQSDALTSSPACLGGWNVG
jgi:hypothetical protein